MSWFFVYVWLLSTSWMLLRQGTYSISDRISQGTPLSGNQTIVSKNGEFELGFFAPNGTQNRYYIGIWYKTAPGRPVIWVANRVSPVSSPDSSEFGISEQGNLVILDQSKAQVWASSPAHGAPPNASAALVARLLDTGSLVLTSGAAGEVAGTGDAVLWQSFDEPTDTWIPGQKIGWNNRGEIKGVTSWRSPRDPSPGWYYFGLDPDGTDQLVQMWNRSVVYWTSGEWNGEIFSLVPEMTRNAVFNYVYNETEKTLSYYLKDTSIVTRFVAERSGQGMQYAWLNRSAQWMAVWLQPTALCDIYSYCGVFSLCNQTSSVTCQCLPGYQPASSNEWAGNDHTSGCRPSSMKSGCISSGNSDAKGRDGGGGKEGFLVMPGVKPPLNPISLPAKAKITAAECEAACLEDCSCTAYVFDNQRCSTWRTNLTGIQQLPPGDNSAVVLHLRRVVSDQSRQTSEADSSSNAGRIAGFTVAVAAGVLLLVASCIFLVRLKNRSREYKESMDGTLLQFRYDTLQRATNNFSDRLGGGGFGSVFKGSLPPPNSIAIAVKKLEGLRLHGEKQFRTEVSTVGTIQHINIVKLLGFCSEGEHRLLVYEYLPNGSLDKHLFQDGGGKEENPTAPLDWKTRYQVALGVARGLAYLHDKCIECIIHCDIKPENILLDEEFRPKVSDLGMAKLIGRDFSRVLTTMRGTMGYLAPEWLSGEPITPKADVYAFGMMLFEIISGNRNAVYREERDFFFFPVWAAKRIADGEVLSLVEEKVKGDINVEELNRACKVACWCIQDGEARRPSMALVVQVLEGVLDVSVPPVPKGLQHLVEAEEVNHFFTEP